MGVYAIDKLMSETRRLAAEYRRATGKTLPVSAEIALHDAVRLMSLGMAEGNDLGFDAVRNDSAGPRRIQVKGRVIFDESKPGHRIGQLRLDKPWDSVMLVLMDEDYEPFEIYEAEREDIESCLSGRGNTHRSRRGTMSVAQFKIIGRRAWSREHGVEDDYWENQAG